MSKKHFIHFVSVHGEMAFSHMVKMLAEFCRTQNAQFDRARWLAYIAGECGPNGGKLGGKLGGRAR